MSYFDLELPTRSQFKNEADYLVAIKEHAAKRPQPCSDAFYAQHEEERKERDQNRGEKFRTTPWYSK
jgi:hypothetical protein